MWNLRQYFFLSGIAIAFVCGMYLYFFNYLDSNYEDLTNRRCLTELGSLKYQLNVVTEYKNRLDKLLNDMQRKCDSERERFKETIDSCLAMKQQTSICQSQFEDLEVECKKVKTELDEVKKELSKLKPPR